MVRVVWREKHAEERDYTYSARHCSRIDMIWGTEKICAGASLVSIGERIYSNHSPVMIIWGCDGRKMEQFCWRLNNCLLEAKWVKEEILAKIKMSLDINIDCTYNVIVWETFKVLLTGRVNISEF